MQAENGHAGNAAEPLCPHEVRFDQRLRAWLVGDVSSARTVLGDHACFSTQGYQVNDADLSDIRRFLMASPSKHRLLRKAMTSAFAAGRIAEIGEAALQPAADALSAALPAAGRVNLQASFVSPYTRKAMYGLIGLGQRHGDELAVAFRVCRRYWLEQRDPERAQAALRLLRLRAAAICASPDDERLPSSLLGLAERQHWLDAGLTVEDLVCFIMPLIEAVAVKAHRDLTATLLRRTAAMTREEQARLLATGAFVGAAEEAVRLQQGSSPDELTGHGGLIGTEVGNLTIVPREISDAPGSDACYTVALARPLNAIRSLVALTILAERELPSTVLVRIGDPLMLIKAGRWVHPIQRGRRWRSPWLELPEPGDLLRVLHTENP